MFIKLKDFVCSSRGSISALSADINKLVEIPHNALITKRRNRI